ncbi:hypothetical protein N0S72_04240 [Klebsiella pneumoniae]|uniref:hypothetical protein n=1 Tax=Klebsiella pneumoniae TaxID=573 RepID=UPI00217FE2C7|nr:hypothetical protein [Klebsiella pneumoniae]MCS7326502.1 hypothetical protein [Klebsiella pneumoniae]MCS7339841.1 hypothetical protein [Klebsiella pneumoniae]
MAFNNHFAHYSLFSYSKSQGNSFSHTCCLYCPAYLTAVAFSDRTRIARRLQCVSTGLDQPQT